MNPRPSVRGRGGGFPIVYQTEKTFQSLRIEFNCCLGIIDRAGAPDRVIHSWYASTPKMPKFSNKKQINEQTKG